MARHWREMGDRQRLGGQSTLPAASIGGAPSKLNSFAGRADSLRGDWPNSPGRDWELFIQETDAQERAAKVFGICCCASPLVLAVILWAAIKLFS